MTQHNINFDKDIIHYKVAGTGHPVMLIHGFAEDSTIWNNITEALASKFKIILPDIPGSGGSPAFQHHSSEIENYAEVMLAIIQAEQIESIVLIGHSMGGYIALAMAEKQPTSIKALGLFHSTAYADDETKKENRTKSISFIKENGAAAYLKTSVPGLFANPHLHQHPIETLVKTGEEIGVDTLIHYLNAMKSRPDSTHVLSQASFPILFVMGLEDKAVPFSQSLQQSHLPAIGHISILRDSAHMGMIEEPEKTLLILTGFLQAIYV